MYIRRFCTSKERLPCSKFTAYHFSEGQRLSPQHIGRLARMSILDTEVDGSNPGIASVDSAVK